MKSTAPSLIAAALGVLLSLPLAARAQTPPTEPDNFTAQFFANAEENTLIPLFTGGTPDHWRPGVERGNLFFDALHARLRTDFMQPDGTPEKTVYFFYDKLLQYTYDYRTGACSHDNFNVTQQPFFGWVASATLSPQTSQTVLTTDAGAFTSAGPAGLETIATWKYAPPEGSDIREMGLSVAEDSNQTPVAVYWRLSHSPFPVAVTFTYFQNDVPEPPAFVLPAVCVE